MSTVVVRYTLRPEAMTEHVRLIDAVMTQLREEHPDTVDYQVLRLSDGVTFIHVSSSDTPDGTNPLGGSSRPTSDPESRHHQSPRRQMTSATTPVYPPEVS